MCCIGWLTYNDGVPFQVEKVKKYCSSQLLIHNPRNNR